MDCSIVGVGEAVRVMVGTRVGVGAAALISGVDGATEANVGKEGWHAASAIRMTRHALCFME